MNAPNPLLDDLRQCVSDVLLPLQTARTLSGFEALVGSARRVVESMKGSALVPKEILRELYFCTQALRNEAPYVGKESAAVIELANQLEYLFGLILLDEGTSERVPGDPRVL
jgi:hypothetical protein